jgi:predicted Na+-dependent transporter
LVPLAIGLLIKSHSLDTAAEYQPVMTKVSSVAMLALLVVGLGLNISNLIDLIGTGGLIALLLFIVGSLVIGLVLGGREPGVRSVMGLGTAQRNVAAALLVTGQNFGGTQTLPFVLVGAILLLLILLPTAKRLGASVQTTAPQATK